MEADQAAVVLGDGRGQVVEPDFAAHSGEEVKRVDMTSGESLERLAMRELQIHLAAVGFDQTEAVQLARGAIVDQGAEVAPVHIEAFPRGGFDPTVCAAGHGVLAQHAQVVLEDGEPTVEAEGCKVLRDYGGMGFRVLFEEFGNGRFPGFDFMGAFSRGGFRRRRIEILGDGAAADVQMPRDLA